MLRKFFVGLTGGFSDVRDAVDAVWAEIDPATTTSQTEWQSQFGIFWDGTDSAATKQADLETAWSARGGQSTDYLETLLQDAGFDVYVHDPWVSGSPPPFEPRDPSFYTAQPIIGPAVCCGASAGQYCCFDGEGQTCAGDFLQNNVGYLVNDDKGGKAPPPIPDDPDVWPFLIYIGPSVLNPSAPAQVPNSRRAEFERLLLKYRPAHCWIVINVDFVTDGVFDGSFDATFE